MIKQVNLLKWNQTNKHLSKIDNKSWVHPPEALQQGHVAYLVKFLGNIEVDQARGTDVIKEGIRKVKFNQQLQRAQGNKAPKVELTISIDGVAIQDPKLKQISHQYPLHRISYCANDKSDKKFVSFIAKEEDSSKHRCFVFSSDKLAEDILLTIGEAFDLAYKRFLDTSGKDLEYRKQSMILQKKMQDLEKENYTLRQKILELQSIVQNNLIEFNGANNEEKTINECSIAKSNLPPIPPRSFHSTTSPSQDLVNLVTLTPNNRRIENFDDDFNPREADEKKDNLNIDTTSVGADMFGAMPFIPNKDPFGMDDFRNLPANETDLNSAIGVLEKKFSEMMDGFTQGITFGIEDFLQEGGESQLNKKTSS